MKLSLNLTLKGWVHHAQVSIIKQIQQIIIIDHLVKTHKTANFLSLYNNQYTIVNLPWLPNPGSPNHATFNTVFDEATLLPANVVPERKTFGNTTVSDIILCSMAGFWLLLLLFVLCLWFFYIYYNGYIIYL